MSASLLAECVKQFSHLFRHHPKDALRRILEHLQKPNQILLSIFLFSYHLAEITSLYLATLQHTSQISLFISNSPHTSPLFSSLTCGAHNLVYSTPLLMLPSMAAAAAALLETQPDAPPWARPAARRVAHAPERRAAEPPPDPGEFDGSGLRRRELALRLPLALRRSPSTFLSPYTARSSPSASLSPCAAHPPPSSRPGAPEAHRALPGEAQPLVRERGRACSSSSSPRGSLTWTARSRLSSPTPRALRRGGKRPEQAGAATVRPGATCAKGRRREQRDLCGGGSACGGSRMARRCRSGKKASERGGMSSRLERRGK